VLDKGVKNSIEMTRLINEALAESAPSPVEPTAKESAQDDAERSPGERPA
jgi:hypothetical protein